MTERMGISGDNLLVIVDVQSHICSGGDEVVPLINQVTGRFDHIVLAQDWRQRGRHETELGASCQMLLMLFRES